MFLKIENEVNDIRSTLEEFKAMFGNASKSEQIQPTFPSVDPAEEFIPDADLQLPQTEASDLSIASVEEFIPDNPHDSLHLN